MTHRSYLDLTSVSPELPLLPIRELRSSRLSTGLQKKARLPTQIRATPTRYIRLNWKQRNLTLQHLGFILIDPGYCNLKVGEWQYEIVINLE